MTQKIDIKRENDDYILILDGEEHGPVDKKSLQELSDDLHFHFSVTKQP